MAGIGKKASEGAGLLLLKNILLQVSNLGVVAYLARNLSKSDFAVVSISYVVLNFISVFGVSGLNDYVVFYTKDDKDKEMQATFWFGTVIAVVISLLVVAISPWVADFYGNQDIMPIISLLSINFFFQVFVMVPKNLLRKSFDYRSYVIIQLISALLVIFGKVWFAWMGMGVYSLILPQILVLPFETAIIFYRAKFRPGWQWLTKRWKGIFHFTKHVVGTRVIGILVNEGDTMLVGKLISLKALAVYDNAFNFSNVMVSNLVAVVSDVAAPIFSASKNSQEALQGYFQKMLRTLGLLSFPINIGMMVLAKPLILLIYSSKWADSILPFQIFLVFVIFRSLSSPIGNVFNSTGNTKTLFYFTLIFTPFFFLSMLIGYFWGFLGIVIGVSAVRLLGSMVQFYLAARYLEMPFRKVFESFLGPLISGVLMATLVVLFDQFAAVPFVSRFPENQGYLIRLVLGSAVGALSYWSALRLLFPIDYQFLMEHFLNKMLVKLKLKKV